MAGTVKVGADSKKKNNAPLIIIITVLAVVVIALVVAMVILLGRGKNDGSSADSVGTEAATRQVAGSVRTVVDEASAQNVMDQMREEVAEGMFECKMSMNWTFEDGKSASKDAYVANSSNNTHPIYFDVLMNDTEEVLYSSPVIPVGADLRDIKLDKELPAGDYKATVMYTLLKDAESQEKISSAGFVISIKVQN